MDDQITYFGETDARNKHVKFGIKREDRSRHMYVIGKTGMGKSTLLENLAVQDINNGEGFVFIDPHGKSADLLLEYIPEHRIKDVVYLAPFDLEYPISFNVMEDVGPERRHLVASGLMSAFKKIWVDAWSARMEYILNNILLALLEYPDSTLIGVNRMLADKDYRKKVVDNITDPSVKSFWVDEYAKYTDKFAAEAAPAIQNKVGQFVSNPLVRNIIGQPKSSFDIRKLMDEQKILIINLSKGRVGESNANLLGSMLITKIYLAAMSRADLSEKELKASPHFYLYVDEFQSFANESFADILSEARKYKLNLIVAHQYIEQMSEEVRAAVFGNVGSMIVFRVGAYDAEVLEKEFAPQFTAEDIVNLQRYQMYLKLMIDGVSSAPFSATGMPPIAKPEVNNMQKIIETSRATYAHTRDEVEDEIRRWHEGKGGSEAVDGKEVGHARDSRDGGSRDGGRESAGRDGGRSGERGGDRARSSDRGCDRRDGGSRGPRDNGPRRDDRGGDRRDSSRDGSRDSGSRTPREGDSRVSREGDRPRNDRNDSRPRDSSRDTSPRREDRPRNDQPRSESQSNASVHSAPQSRMSTSTNDTSPIPSSKNTEHNHDERENRLRKAISLSYLRSEPEVKNDQKTMKPENLAALRDALKNVMGDDSSSVNSDSKSNHTDVVERDATTERAQQPITQPKSEHKQHTVEHKHDSHAHHVRHNDASRVEQQPVKHTKKAPAEVPEDILKKMLEVEE